MISILRTTERPVTRSFTPHKTPGSPMPNNRTVFNFAPSPGKERLARSNLATISEAKTATLAAAIGSKTGTHAAASGSRTGTPSAANASKVGSPTAAIGSRFGSLANGVGLKISSDCGSTKGTLSTAVSVKRKIQFADADDRIESPAKRRILEEMSPRKSRRTRSETADFVSDPALKVEPADLKDDVIVCSRPPSSTGSRSSSRIARMLQMEKKSPFYFSTPTFGLPDSKKDNFHLTTSVISPKIPHVPKFKLCPPPKSKKDAHTICPRITRSKTLLDYFKKS